MSITVSAFVDSPRFPVSPIWQVVADDLFATVITRRASGGERRYLPTRYKVTTFQITIPADRLADAKFVRAWYLAVYGQTTGFRLRRPNDYLSCTQVDWLLDGPVPKNPSTQNTPTALDQPLQLLTGTLGASGSTYQLMKSYGTNAILGGGALEPYLHRILKPVAGTILIANDSSLTQPGTAWTLDTTTGILTQGGSFAGTPTTWGGEFDYPVRFDDKYSEQIETNRADPADLTLIELPQP